MRICAFALCLAWFAAPVAPAADPVLVEQIIAKVNGDIITRTELDRELQQVEAGLRARGATPEQIQKEVEARQPDLLRDRIDSLLLIQRGRDLNINVDQDVSKYLGQIQSQNKIADPDKFQAWIREQTGMSFEDFRSETRNGILSQRVIGQEVSSKINIPRADVVKYYEEHKDEFNRKERIFLREIFVSNEGRTLEEAEKKATELLTRARRGERFAELARDNSDSVSAAEGGAMPPFERTGDFALDATIAEQVWDKPRNHITDLIKRDNGFLILRVEMQHREGLAELDEVENEVREKLFEPRIRPRIREYLTELRRDAFLEIREGWVDTGAAPGKDTAWTDPAMLRPETVTKQEVMSQIRRRRLLWMMPVPGTNVASSGKSTSR
ncbi:MAG: SurA N-terminal domain-containing protein [Bryobacteraceae bacterium]|nr:SurA N-terminal domain-containing protein [Bryobacteraceae bacterium]